MHILTRRGYGLLAVAVIAAGSVAGCSTSEKQRDDAAKTVTVSDQWVKAADSGMTAAFGTLKNSGQREVRVVSATSSVAGKAELHEVVTAAGGSPTMRPKDGGFVVPAGGSLSLVPGGDHIMLMDLKQPLAVGSDVNVTVQFEDGSSLPFTAQVRDFPGAGEHYHPGDAPAAGGHG